MPYPSIGTYAPGRLFVRICVLSIPARVAQVVDDRKSLVVPLGFSPEFEGGSTDYHVRFYQTGV
jgi:hypothetical protein